QAAKSKTRLLLRMWRMMRVLNLRVRNRARAFDFLLDLGGAAGFAQPPIGKQLEEHRHEENGEEGRRHHPAHDAGADRAARAGARAGRVRRARPRRGPVPPPRLRGAAEHYSRVAALSAPAASPPPRAPPVRRGRLASRAPLPPLLRPPLELAARITGLPPSDLLFQV